MNNLLSNLKSLSRIQQILLGATTALVFGLITYFSFFSHTSSNRLLYGNLNLTEASEMADDLSRSHIAFNVSNDGTRIYVPENKVALARMLLAKAGLPNGGAVGYEIFDKGGTLTSTQFEQTVNQTRAMEGELERSIRLLQGVKNVRVHIVLPRRDLFSTKTNPSQASVVVDTGWGRRLLPESVQAIQNLVAAAVPELQPYNISIVDTHGDVLAKPGNPDSMAGQEQQMEKYRHGEEERLDEVVEDMLIPILGAGHVRARSSVSMSTEEVHMTQEDYDPNQQILRSQQTSTDKSVNSEASPTTSVGNNLPNGGGSQERAGSNSNHEEETDNYEIGKRTQILNQTRPRIARVSMAVMVDGNVSKGKGGKIDWKPLDDKQLARITTLVQTAVGFDKKRGDEVRVVSMRFMQDGGYDMQPEAKPFLTKATLIYMAEWIIPLLLVIFAAAMLLRPLLLRFGIRILPWDKKPIAEGEEAQIEGGKEPQQVGKEGSEKKEAQGEDAQKQQGEQDSPSEENEDQDMSGSGISKDVMAKVSKSAMTDVASHFENDTEDSVRIIRGWIASSDQNDQPPDNPEDM